jgi:hypothetical protein
MMHPIVRRAEPHDAEGIARVCAAGWRDTYRGIKEQERIEAVIAEYYTPERNQSRDRCPRALGRLDRGSRRRHR